jgi:ASC-1-like (ASCH) protein
MSIMHFIIILLILLIITAILRYSSRPATRIGGKEKKRRPKEEKKENKILVTDAVWWAIENNIKTVELLDNRQISIDDKLVFVNDAGETIPANVTRIKGYRDIAHALHVEGLTEVLPGSQTLRECIDYYQNHIRDPNAPVVAVAFVK